MTTGECVRLVALDGGLVEMCFDRKGEAINKIDQKTLDEFEQAVRSLEEAPGVRGVIVTSAKEVFIVGADIKEFGRKFSKSAGEIARDVLASNQVFVRFEDLPFPTVAAINGYALGGGLELALSASRRVMSDQAQVGVPEVKLGLFPGFGGTVRLSRVGSAGTGMEWVTSGKSFKAADALNAGVVDQVVAQGRLREEAMAHLWRCVEGQIDWRDAQQRKRAPARDTDPRPFDDMLAKLATRAALHQPAAAMAVRMMREAAGCDRARALELEAEAFGAVTQTQAARSMVQTFVNEQWVKKLARGHAQGGRKAGRVVVVGAGIMGGGIAYTTALRGTPVVLKDISQAALDLGMSEARRQLSRQVQQGRVSQEKAEGVLARITAQGHDEGLEGVDLVVEAVVENLAVKHEVLGKLQGQLPAGTVLASNTSSLRIDDVAQALSSPEHLVGLHFFNPVPVMPLVEIVRGRLSSPQALASAAAFAVSLGKSPIVVQDGPGFLVNRILTPYIIAFCDLVAEGGDYEIIDKALEAFGWPMGPAYLEDVVGLDTGSHVIDTISAGYPQRMHPPEHNAIRCLVLARRLGQKSGAGFYDHAAAGGKSSRSPSPVARELIAPLQRTASQAPTDEQLVERMMLPLLLEAIRCIEEGVVASAAELDTAMLLGVGFPAYLGGPLQYADWLGLPHLLARCSALSTFGPLYEAPELLRKMAASTGKFYPTE